MRISESSVFVIVCDGSRAIFALASDGTTKSTMQKIISGGNEGCDALSDILWFVVEVRGWQLGASAPLEHHRLVGFHRG